MLERLNPFAGVGGFGQAGVRVLSEVEEAFLLDFGLVLWSLLLVEFRQTVVLKETGLDIAIIK
jgi:hypothetical protein